LRRKERDKKEKGKRKKEKGKRQKIDITSDFTQLIAVCLIILI
jgi:hypothetical protein